jgi:SAM-dependent methyltransferase/Tfp pilus assembly protein PilF
MQSSAIPSAQKNFGAAVNAIKKNSLIEAEALLAQAISEDETFQVAWHQLGMVWTKMGRDTEAVDAFRMAVSLDNKNIDSLYNLGRALISIGQENEGLSMMNQASELSDNPEIAISLGNTYQKMMDYKKSSFFYLKAYQKDKNSPELIQNLSVSLFQDGDTSRAVLLARDLLLRFPTNEKYKALYAELMNKWAQAEFDADTKKALEICLEQDFIRHRNLAPAWCGTFLTDPAYEMIRNFPHLKGEDIDIEKMASALKSSFICLGLRRIIIANAPIENILMHIRRYFIMNWENHKSWPRGVLEFLSALAVQCWYNDFIYFETPDDKQKLQNLLDYIASDSFSAKKINDDDAKLLALACCFKPLYEIIPPDRKIEFSPSCKKTMAPLLKAQFENPKYELSLIPKIKSFTEIEDVTSKAVQKMYESRPYPRWTSVNSTKVSDSLKKISHDIEILVAGCGTGQEPCLYASVLPDAKITAIDLSRSSIAYGMRMAEELGYLNRITFLHGDLMKVSELNKKFDYVVSSGVLHHLKEPEKGLAAILSTLKEGGKMSLSLYSKHARDIILNPASDYIKEKNYSSSLDDIRQFRQDIFKCSPGDPKTFCSRAGDFFNLSECNDLLFHVQEHRYTFPLIQDMANRHGLAPYLVSLSAQKKKDFLEMFPDGQLSDLDLMDKYELKYPDAFAEMYKVYFSRKGNNSPHPLDILIQLGSI